MKRTLGSNLKNQSELIEELRKRQQFRFQLSVYLSWLGLLIILLFAFSGFEAQFLGIQVRTIKLDFQFILHFFFTNWRIICLPINPVPPITSKCGLNIVIIAIIFFINFN